MKMVIKKKKTNGTLQEYMPDVSKGVFSNENIDLDVSDGIYVHEIKPGWFISTVADDYIRCGVRLRILESHYSKLKDNHDFMQDLTEMRANYKKLGATLMSTAFTTTSIRVVSKEEIGVGYDGFKLCLLNTMKRVEHVECVTLYNPMGVDFSGLTEDQKVYTNVYYYNRIVDCEFDPFAINFVKQHPVSILHLSPYIEEMSRCYKRVLAETVVSASITLFSKLRFVGVEYSDVEVNLRFVPRSLEDMFKICGYNVQFPISDMEAGTLFYRRGTTLAGIKLTCLDVVCMALSGEDLSNFEPYTDLKEGYDQLIKLKDPAVLNSLRNYYRLFVMLYKSNSKIERIHLDLKEFLDEADRTK